jgi:hypothetical protein
MEPDLLDGEPLLTGKKAHEVREASSPMRQLGWLFAIAFIGFAATTTALWFGPSAVEYVREFAAPFTGDASKSGDAPKSNPWGIRDFNLKLLGDPQKPVVLRPPSIPQFTIPQGNGFSAPQSGSSFRLHRHR